MKKRVLSVITAVLAAFVMCVTAFAADVPAAVSRAASSAVRLTVKTNLGTEKTTGIAIGKDKDAKYILTCLRSVENGEILVGTSDEQNVKASVIASDAKSNLAVLELSEPLVGVKPIKIKIKEIKEGAPVYAVGYYASDDETAVTEGTIMAKSDLSSGGIEVGVYQTSARISERNSGGMLCDRSGAAVGICYYDGNAGANKAITGEAISEMLTNNQIEYKKATILYTLLAAALIAAIVAAAVIFAVSSFNKKKKNRPRLVGTAGDFNGQEIPVTSETINIGRDAKICQVVILSDTKVSRCHCGVRYDEMKHSFIITDLSSTHGTYVNGEKLEPNVPKYIPSGTVFNVGTGNTAFMTVEGGAEQ